jgi:hypothetical protein
MGQEIYVFKYGVKTIYSSCHSFIFIKVSTLKNFFGIDTSISMVLPWFCQIVCENIRWLRPGRKGAYNPMPSKVEGVLATIQGYLVECVICHSKHSLHLTAKRRDARKGKSLDSNLIAYTIATQSMISWVLHRLSWLETYLMAENRISSLHIHYR